MYIEDKIQAQIDGEKKFFAHLLNYTLVNGIIIILFFLYSPHSYQWFWWMLFGWGIGLTSHAFKVFLLPNLTLGRWEEKRRNSLRKRYSKHTENQEASNLPRKF